MTNNPSADKKMLSSTPTYKIDQNRVVDSCWLLPSEFGPAKWSLHHWKCAQPNLVYNEATSNLLVYQLSVPTWCTTGCINLVYQLRDLVYSPAMRAHQLIIYVTSDCNQQSIKLCKQNTSYLAVEWRQSSV